MISKKITTNDLNENDNLIDFLNIFNHHKFLSNIKKEAKQSGYIGGVIISEFIVKDKIKEFLQNKVTELTWSYFFINDFLDISLNFEDRNKEKTVFFID